MPPRNCRGVESRANSSSYCVAHRNRDRIPRSNLVCAYARSSDVQFGQRVAFSGMDDAQYGHSFVVAAGAGAGLFQAFTIFTIRKTAKATIRKSTTLFRKSP